jgi:hypothetical protein
MGEMDLQMAGLTVDQSVLIMVAWSVACVKTSKNTRIVLNVYLKKL